MINIERAAEVGRTQESIERRANNRISSATILEAHGVEYQARNGGAHLIVQRGDKIADFWPGTGKYKTRGAGSITARGVFNLLKWLGVN